MKSDIFNEYLKVAESEGWVKEADYADVRIGSDDVSAIEAMYGIKPNGKEDDTHIVDKAHPETVVVAPAHDKMNGVVENTKERQNMMAYVALKMPNGNLTQHRYVAAYDDLNKALIRTAFTLDNQNDLELMTLADNCASRLEKTAGIWLPIAAGLALLAVINKTDEMKQNVITNGESVLDELEDIKDHAPVEHMMKDVQELVTMAYNFKPVQAKILSAEDASNAVQQYGNEIGAVKQYLLKLQEIKGKIPAWVTTLKTIEPEGNLPDWMQKIWGGINLFIASGIEDAINALGDPDAMTGTGGLYAAIDGGISSAKHVLNQTGRIATQLEKSQAQVPAVSESKTDSGSSAPNTNSGPLESLVERIQGMIPSV